MKSLSDRITTQPAPPLPISVSDCLEYHGPLLDLHDMFFFKIIVPQQHDNVLTIAVVLSDSRLTVLDQLDL